MKKEKNIIRIIDVTNRDGVQTSRLGRMLLMLSVIRPVSDPKSSRLVFDKRCPPIRTPQNR